jgi:hypothetical protein
MMKLMQHKHYLELCMSRVKVATSNRMSINKKVQIRAAQKSGIDIDNELEHPWYKNTDFA